MICGQRLQPWTFPSCFRAAFYVFTGVDVMYVLSLHRLQSKTIIQFKQSFYFYSHGEKTAILFLKIYFHFQLCVCACMCFCEHVCANTRVQCSQNQRRVLDLELQVVVCWEQNSGFLKEWCVLLTAEPSFQNLPHHPHHQIYFYRTLICSQT